MTNRFQNKIVVIAGATGGLGSAFARAFAGEGAALVLAGRDPEALSNLAAELGGDVRTFPLDLTNSLAPTALGDFVRQAYGRVDVVVNATGIDVRKPFAQHTLSDFHRTLNVNLMGAFLLTHAFLPLMRSQNDGIIVHVGGFADGRLAFPYYSANVATRAGLFSFAESLNRELSLEGSRVMVSYFSPSPADTQAEQPFHAIWREMGLKITAKEKVAAELLDAVAKRRRVHIMGGLAAVLFAKLNSVWPRLADALLLNRYGGILKRYLAAQDAPASLPPAPMTTWAKWMGMGLIVFSFLLYGVLIALPFALIPVQDKLAISPALVIVSEISFWVGGLIVGKEIVARYKRYLDPRWWLCCQTSNASME